MNGKLILILLVTVLALTMAACNTNDTPATDATDATEESLIPGVVGLDTPVENPFENDGTEAAADPTDPTEATEPGTGETEHPTEATTPTEKEEDPTEEPTAPSENTEDPTEDSTAPTEGAEDPTEDTTPPTTEGGSQVESSATAYENYINMSGADQLAFMQSFDSMEAFFAWLNAAKAEYEAQNPGIDVGDGNIDLGGGN